MPFDGESPDLPDGGVPGLDVPWPQRTRDKWETWRTMPHCKLWGTGEWDFALDSIAVAALFHLSGEPKYATELRNRERVLGTTWDSRQSLRIRYYEPKAVPTGADLASVTDIASYLDL